MTFENFASEGQMSHLISKVTLFVAVCCNLLQCVAVRCSVLQCVAVCCSALQCVAVRCSVLQCVAVCCSALQRVACGWFRESKQRADISEFCPFIGKWLTVVAQKICRISQKSDCYYIYYVTLCRRWLSRIWSSHRQVGDCGTKNL